MNKNVGQFQFRKTYLDEQASEGNTRRITYSILATVMLAMLVHIEIGFSATFAPEAILLQIQETEGVLEINGECFADIISNGINEQKKPLTALESVYDFIDSSSFSVNIDKGFHLLETGFIDYEDEFEIRIVCYTPNFEGVSYTIINSETQKNCGIKDGGKIVVC